MGRNSNDAAAIEPDADTVGMRALAFPVGSSYYRHGYWIYREVFHRLVRAVLPERLVETNAPISAGISVTHQRAGADLDKIQKDRLALLEELAKLRKLKLETLQQRMAIRVLEIGEEGKLYYYDPQRARDRRINSRKSRCRSFR